MSEVVLPRKEATTNTYKPNNSIRVNTLTLSQFKSRHPNSTATITFEGFQEVTAKIREASQATNEAKSSSFERTREQSEHIRGTHRRRDAALRMQPLANGRRDPWGVI